MNFLEWLCISVMTVLVVMHGMLAWVSANKVPAWVHSLKFHYVFAGLTITCGFISALIAFAEFEKDDDGRAYILWGVIALGSLFGGINQLRRIHQLHASYLRRASYLR